MLQLATATFGKVPAWRHLVMWPCLNVTAGQHAITGRRKGHMAPIRRHAFAAGGNPHDLINITHSYYSQIIVFTAYHAAIVGWPTRSSAMKAAPARRAASA